MIALFLCSCAYFLIGIGVALYVAVQLHKSNFRASMAGVFWLPLVMVCVGVWLAEFMAEQVDKT